MRPADGRGAPHRGDARLPERDETPSSSCYARDITERAARGARCARAKRSYGRWSTRLPDIIVWLKDPDGVYLSCNPARRDLLGLRPRRTSSAGPTTTSSTPSWRISSARDDRAAAAAGGPTASTKRSVRRWMESRIVPVRGDEGSSCRRGVTRDVTERSGRGALAHSRRPPVTRSLDHDRRRLRSQRPLRYPRLQPRRAAAHDDPRRSTRRSRGALAGRTRKELEQAGTLAVRDASPRKDGTITPMEIAGNRP